MKKYINNVTNTSKATIAIPIKNRTSDLLLDLLRKKYKLEQLKIFGLSTAEELS